MGHRSGPAAAVHHGRRRTPLVVTKRLILRERLRIRRVGTTERQLFEDTLRRERLIVDDPQPTGLVQERYPTGEQIDRDAPSAHREGEPSEKPESGFLEHLVRKALE